MQACSVGPNVGARVGADDDGVVLGELVGESDGTDDDGCVVGDSVGFRDGESVVGMLVGAMLGELVTGEADGPVLGESETGESEGPPVGDDDVGCFDGACGSSQVSSGPMMLLALRPAAWCFSAAMVTRSHSRAFSQRSATVRCAHCPPPASRAQCGARRGR